MVNSSIRDAMDAASALLELVGDAAAGAHSTNSSEKDLIDRLGDVWKQLQRAGSGSIRPEAAAIAVCHVTTQVVAFLERHRPISTQTASSKWHKRVILLEMAVASAFTIVGGFANGKFELEALDRNDFCCVYKGFLQRLWGAIKSPQLAVNTVAITTRCCLLLACCWLSYDRVGKLVKVEELLNVCSDFCLKHETTMALAKWPLFLLGLVNMVEKKNQDEALQCFKEAERCGGEDGVFFYWYAVALIQNDLGGEAVAALDKCIQLNYEPVACLSLQALVNLQARDFHSAAEQLQRTLEIDFSHPPSLFNYALLMERLDNFEMQQQLLEHILVGLGDDKDKSGRSNIVANSDSSGLADAPTAVFNQVRSSHLFPSELVEINPSIVHFHLAVAAMENGSCYFVIGLRLRAASGRFTRFTFAGDLICQLTFRLLFTQCKLPSLALRICEAYLQKFDGGNISNEDVATVSILLLHLYKADALLCLERVDDCYKHLKQVAQPKIQDAMRRPNAGQMNDVISEEITASHTQLINNLAVTISCCDAVDVAISILREGLQLYPECLAIKFNLVLLLWRNGDKVAACSVWAQARGWALTAMSNDHESKDAAGEAERCALTATSTFQIPSISEHVEGSIDGEEGISAQQLVYLDALIINYRRNTWNSKLLDNALQYAKHIESLGSNSAIQDH
ncbi:unnamed protein product [Phytophthora lilii]|uniref:Unnamed protein product n=1 Tax=Phytophthora lilii TaxID=2077276 RepID=A0A9W6YD94_9STRA|nr:unnamed protein product [Phytophthora lilii]